MSDETPGPQRVELPELQVALGTSVDYGPEWIAHFQAQEAPQVAGVDPTLFVSSDDGGTAYA